MTESLSIRNSQNSFTVNQHETVKENEVPYNILEELRNNDYSQSSLPNSASTILKCSNSGNINTNSSEPISFTNPVHVAPFFVAEKNVNNQKPTIREEVIRRNNIYGNNLYTFNSYMEERLIRWRPSLSQNNVDDTLNGKHVYFSMEDQSNKKPRENGVMQVCKQSLETYGIIDSESQVSNIDNSTNKQKAAPKVMREDNKVADNSNIPIQEDFTILNAEEISIYYQNEHLVKENIRNGKQKLSVTELHEHITPFITTRQNTVIDAYPVEQNDIQYSKSNNSIQPQATQPVEISKPSICCGFPFNI